jgi:HPt (histidine-containing phosphotransfer) domain-containing protein
MEEATTRDADNRFDFDATLHRMGDDYELFVKMIEFFVDDHGPLLRQIESGIDQHSAKCVEQAAHSIKGLVANFSADDAIRAAARLEEAGRNANLTDATGLLELLRREVSLLERELAAYIPDKGDG